MKNLKVGVRLYLLVIFVAVILIVVGAMGLSGMRSTDEGLETVYNDRLVPLGQIAQINVYMLENIQQMLLASFHDKRLEESKLHEDTHSVSTHTDKVEDNIGKISEIWKLYMSTYLTPDEAKIAKAYAESRSDFVNKGLREGIALLKAGNFRDSNMHNVKVLIPLFKEAKKHAAALTQLQLDVANAERIKADKRYEWFRNISLTLMIGGLIFALIVAWWIINSITRPLHEGLVIANKLAEGDLTVNIESDSSDEVGQLLKAIGNMVDKLKQVLSDVMTAAGQVSSGSNELSSTSQQLSEGATEQAASIEETSSSMEEMTANIKQNSDNSQRTSGIAVQASKDAEEGGKVVDKALDAMKQIADKISIIEEIARQTNLLALNAAIEAARAGEQGKGFAVVASEVRKLAERSQTAAAEISELSASSVGVAEKAGEVLNKLVPDIQKTSELVEEINSSSAEQRTGAEQINKAVQQLDRVIQQNASSAEEMASTSEELSSQATLLQETVSFFSIGKDNSGTKTSRVPQKPAVRQKPAAKQKTAPRTPSPKPPIQRPAASQQKALPLDRRSKSGGVELDLEDDEYTNF